MLAALHMEGKGQRSLNMLKESMGLTREEKQGGLLCAPGSFQVPEAGTRSGSGSSTATLTFGPREMSRFHGNPSSHKSEQLDAWGGRLWPLLYLTVTLLSSQRLTALHSTVAPGHPRS